MGKRRHKFVFLSDDEEADELSNEKPVGDKRKTIFAKQATTSSLSNKEHSQKRGLTKPQGMTCPSGVPYVQPWTEKYTPREISALAVHVKKVSEVREWMLLTLQNFGKLCGGGNILVLSGPTGAGKTVVVHTLVNQMQEVELCEWDPPVPTLWKEHLHHVNSDVPYISKVDQFIDFLSKVQKYPGLPLVHQGSNDLTENVTLRSTKTGKCKVLLIDDLPLVHGQELMSKLCHCLHNFTLSARFPTIVIITEFPEEEHGQDISFLTTDIVQALESGGAKKVLFNPITANAIRKVLNKIVLAEKCTISMETLSFIAESSGGDIRHAINCLEFLCIGLKSASDNWDPGGDQLFFVNPKRRRGTKNGTQKKQERSVECSGLAAGELLSIGCRDGPLSLFHALGKVLYNKRLTDNNKDSGQSSLNFALKDDLQRHPLKMGSPEVLISQAHADAASFLHFLHENVLEFVDDEGIEDVSVTFAYFSDVDCLLKHRKRTTAASSRMPDEIDSALIAEAVAGSVAARGTLFANTHPAKRRWLSLRAPGILQADRLLNKKKAELRAKLWTSLMGSCTMFTCNVQATELEPYFKSMSTWHNTVPRKLQNMADSNSCGHELHSPLLFSHDEEYFPDVMAIDLGKDRDVGTMSKSDDDEIEEW